MFWRLHRAPEQPDERLALEHAFRISTFARAAFLWAESCLVKTSFVGERLAAPPSAQLDPRAPPLPYLDFDVDFFLQDDRAMLGRLNEFGETIEVSARELAIALLFDGTTTAREAAALVGRSGDEDAATDAVGRTLSRLTRAGFCFPASA